MNAVLPARRMPLTVIGGFLGSGKTTLLNRLLDESRGQRLAVLVNDFGAINIDAALVARRDADTIALSNGCACCSIGADLTSALIRVLDARERFDAVVIEASGVADPWRMAQVGLADPALAPNGVVVLVDAAAALEQARDPLLADTLARQLRAADLVVLNKIDLVDPARRRRVRDWIAREAGTVEVLETVQAAVPLPLIGGPALDGPAALRAHDESAPRRGATPCGPSAAVSDGRASHAAAFETWSCEPAHVLAAAALRDWLQAVPPGVLRVKALLRTDELDWCELQFAGRHGSLRRAAAPAERAAVVAIGLRGRLPVAALAAVFERG